jgi:hypothetical protein
VNGAARIGARRCAVRSKTHYFGFRPIAPVLPPGEKGNAKIDHFTITGREFLGFRSDDYIVPGTYARLLINGQTMMSDTQMEQRTNCDALQAARGNVLIAGLGIGMLLLPVLMKSDVAQVTVLELNQNVIDLVEPHIRKAAGKHARKLRILQMDAKAFGQPVRIDAHSGTPIKYDTIWLDIWGSLSTDDLDEMRAMRRQHRKWLKKGGWLGSWYWDDLRARLREEKRNDPYAAIGGRMRA